MASEDAMDVEAAAGLSGMEVESSPDALLSAAAAAASSDVNVVNDARQVVVAFLADHRSDEVVPENSRVVLLDADIRLSAAFRALLENGIRAAPVLSTQSQTFIGMLTVTDLIAAVRHFRYVPGADIARCIAMQTVRSWFGQCPQGDFHYADAEESLLQACLKMRNFCIHRLPVIFNKKKVLFTMEHWRVLRFVHRHLAGREDPRAVALLNLTVSHLGIGTFSGLVTVRENASFMEVLDLLIDHNLSAVPIVDANGKLRDVYSRTDITVIARDEISATSMDITITDALLRLRPREFRLATCRKSDTLRTVFEIFEQSRKHRLYAVNDHGVLEGVLSLSDILVYFLDGV